MKTLITILGLLGGVFNGYSQDPAILWQKTIGASASDVMQALEPTSDGGFIIAGYSSSNISGEKTENSKGKEDIWIVKADAVGTILWQKTIGGNGDDVPFSIKQTADGGYIVGASSESNISGDKTENSRGGLDFWILKLDSTGNITWQKTYGGAQPEMDTYVVPTSDGGYFVGGYSDSSISGDKTEATNGQRDYWALKLNSSGAIVWQKSIGGSLVDRVQMAFQSLDGNYMLGGFSTSGISGNKTEANRGVTDYWIVKLDPTGNVLWDKTYGGSESDAFRNMIQTADGGYLLGGYSKSNISGDKTQNSFGDYDYWVLKLNSSGNQIWQKTIGGTGVDYLRSMKQLSDGTYLLAGYSNSPISGSKTMPSKGGYDYWLVHLNSTGDIMGQNSMGGAADESGPYIIPLSDGGFLLGCTSASNISGDKTENSRGSEDYWIFKTDLSLLGISNNSRTKEFSVYPNPTKGNLTIKLGKEYQEVTVQIYTATGQLISSEKYRSAKNIATNLKGAAGIYFLKISTSKEESKTLRIIKQ